MKPKYLRPISRGKIFTFAAVILLIGSMLLADSGRTFRRYNVHRGNLVKTVFGNWGVVGQPSDKGPRGAWIYDNNGYVGDVSPLVGAKITTVDTAGNAVTFHSVVVSPVDRPTSGGVEEAPDGSKRWGLEPVNGYFNPSGKGIALSNASSTWPTSWPDKDATWNGFWNGYFGKESGADEESYYVMDDNNDEEFNNEAFNSYNVAFKPDSADLSRSGLGLEVRVRGMQWAQVLAQDVIFWLYEVTNNSTTNYNQVTFGSLVGTYVGVTSTEDYQEYDDDWSFFDVEKNLTYTGDFDNNVSRNPTWVGSAVGMVGYAFLESPGNPYNGIDDDQDADEYGTAAVFEESDFAYKILTNGDLIVLINDDYNRTVITVTNTPQVFATRGGYSLTLAAGDTLFPEGNEVLRPGATSATDMTVNSNAYDGIDNDFDGLIDENYYLHYRQVRKDQEGNTLFDIINPTSYIDYVTGLGLLNPMIDENREDGVDNDSDWDPVYDDVGSDGVADSEDPDNTEGNGLPDPGEPNFDATDPDESDQIGLSSFNYFTPAGGFPMKNDEDLWTMMAPGYFDVPSSIQDGRPVGGEDGDFIFSSGYFPLQAGQTERFSIALLYGDDLGDLAKNLSTVQEIYNNDYRFAVPPYKPTLKATVGDGFVKLYWDRKAEDSYDPILREKDFEGYKIYKATDPNFNDAFLITNSLGTVVAYKPVAQFDLDDGITGHFSPSADLLQATNGYTPYLGDDSGLQHTWTDYDVDNGRTYYYAVVAYDRGDSEKDFFPAENTKNITIDETNYEVITDINTVAVVPGPLPPGYTSSDGNDTLEVVNRVSSGKISAEIIDTEALLDHVYEITFQDEATDGIDNDGDWTVANDLNANGVPDIGEKNFEFKDPQELRRLTTSYSVLDTFHYRVTFAHNDTIPSPTGFKNIRPESVILKDFTDVVIDTSDYTLIPEGGFIFASTPGVFLTDSLMIEFQYFPVFESSNIFGSPYASETYDSDIFDGIQLDFENQWTVELIDSTSGWNNLDYYSVEFGTNVIANMRPVVYPSDYSLVFTNDSSYTVNNMDLLTEMGLTYLISSKVVADQETNFYMVNESEEYINDIIWYNFDGVGAPDILDKFLVFDMDDNGNHFFTWQIILKASPVYPDSSFTLGAGDTLHIRTTKPFRSGDILRFHPNVPSIDETQIADYLDEIKVYPNPYVSAHAFEPALPPGVTSGRGERRVYFSNLPYNSEVKLFTSRGEHVQTLYNDANLNNSTIIWNLKSKENLDVAYGVYFYVIDTPKGVKRGKLAVIK